MKIAITGHTGGLGLAFFNYFLNLGHDVIGFSRSNGFNISDPISRLNIVDTIKDFDMFINNAYNDWDSSQLTMLELVYKEWRNKEKTIINVSSRYTKDDNIYCKTKLEMDKFCEEHLYSTPKLINLKPGLLDTSRVTNISGERLSVDNVVKVLEFALANSIQSVTFGRLK